MDMSSSLIAYTIVAWNLFELGMFFTGLTEDSWFLDKDKMIFDEKHPKMLMIRGVFILVFFLISIPFFLKKNLRALHNLTMLFLIVLILLVAMILTEAPAFYLAYPSTPRHAFKPFQGYWIQCFFSVLLAFYVQPFVLSLRGELIDPSKKRMTKVSTITIAFETVLFCFVGFAGYMALGDNYMTELYLIRQPYPGKSIYTELIFKVVIGLLFLCTSLGISIYNPTIRDYLYQTLNLGEERKTYVIVSLLPFAGYCLIAFLIPNIVSIFNLTGLTICNFNGFIIPSMMAIQLIRKNGGSKFTMYFESFKIVLFVVLAGVGLFYPNRVD